MATLEQKQERVIQATRSGFRGRLLARGQARSMIWRDGELPANSPGFSPLLTYDLLSYGYALISDGLDLLEENGDAEIARTAFEHGAGAIESVIAKSADNTDRDFHRFVAAAGYHLARYSARAFSMLTTQPERANTTIAETCLSHLMLRNMDELERLIAEFKLSGRGGDGALTARLAEIPEDAEFEEQSAPDSEDEPDSVISTIDTALTDGFMSALAEAMLAFERGDFDLLEAARARLTVGMECTAELALVPQWWCHRLAIYLLGDLWSSSFHERLPIISPEAAEAQWVSLREMFIASLYRRSRAEIDLWPSQLGSAARALDVTDNMVVSLPTSAGKTRIAELCILACLATGKRVMFITPLRALSAQTEVVLDRTFTPLGKTVSSLYGSIGMNGIDQNFLRERDIIVATPEKLDFALRNEPNLLDDVGLVVLDEGHMIGLGEREIRYEVQIQKLLCRADAAGRRIVCLSAILPTGDKLDDFVGWLTDDDDEGLIQKDWRPTGLRFGEIEWRNDHGKLEFSVGEERPFVPRYISSFVPPVGRRRNPFPCDQRELCLATAWRLVEDGQSVLIFCPLRRSVEPFAAVIVDLHRRGALPSVFDTNPDILSTALTIGAEWFAADHPMLECLKLGIAIHHGALPTPYRREVERLLRLGILKVTISSPTLAQGLNLSATALIFHGLYRNRKLIDVSEFRNVIGRAGRAFVDVEGLVLYPMYSDIPRKRANWKSLIENNGGKEMESGLLLLVQYLLSRMLKKCNPKTADNLIAYVANAASWDFPALEGENEEQERIERARWQEYIAMLDTAILGLIGESDIPDADIETHLDEILRSSLWTRRLAKREDHIQSILKSGLIERSRYVWVNSTAEQRRAYFFAGVGLGTGLTLDAQAPALNELLIHANGHIINNMEAEAIEAIIEFAEIIFTIAPFTPNNQPENWRDVLAAWLRGDTISSLVGNSDPVTLRFIEEGLIYKLPWGMEAVRVRGLAHNDKIGDDFTMSDFNLSVAVAAVETGTLKVPAALLMKAGFSSRTGAIKAINDGAATFTTLTEMRAWLHAENIAALSAMPNWPTAETHDLWLTFVESLRTTRGKTWAKTTRTVKAIWHKDRIPPDDLPVRLKSNGRVTTILTADYEPIGVTASHINTDHSGILRATVSPVDDSLYITYLGPNNPIPV